MANMTKVAKFNAIAKALEGVTLEGFDVQEFLSNEIAQVERRNARKSNKPSKTQRENAEIKERILTLLADNPDGLMAAEVAKELGLNSPQKASALLKQLKESGEVNREKTGKAVLFTLA